MHGYDACGYHHGDFSTALGQEIYRWSVNRILDRTSLRLRLADEGEDLGRLVAVTDDARTDLAHRMAGRSDEATGDEVRHALAVFRGRNAGVQEKRSACIALAGVLERRRTLLKEHLPKKDEGMLYPARQRVRYPPPERPAADRLRPCISRLGLLVLPRDHRALGSPHRSTSRLGVTLRRSSTGASPRGGWWSRRSLERWLGGAWRCGCMRYCRWVVGVAPRGAGVLVRRAPWRRGRSTCPRGTDACQRLR